MNRPSSDVFRPEDLDQQRARDRERLGQDAGELAHARLHRSLDSLARLADAASRHDEQREKSERHERETPVEREHERGRRYEDDDVLRDIGERAAHRAANALHIVQHVADRLTRLLPGEKGERHRVELAIERDAQVEHHVLTNQLGRSTSGRRRASPRARAPRSWRRNTARAASGRRAESPHRRCAA